MGLIAKLLLIVYSVGLSAPFGAVVNYYANLDFIKETLCLNRDEPIPACNGACYLRLQLLGYFSGQASGELPEPVKQKVNWDIILYAIPLNHLSISNKMYQVAETAIYLIKDYPYPFHKVFHPPQLA